jgi:hypothetical protein
VSDLPATFASAIEEAELNAFAVLCAATGMQSGRNAFIGDAGERLGVMVFGFTDSYQGDAAFWDRHAFTELPFNAEAIGRFRTRREVWEWALRIVQALPIREAHGSLRLFRVERLGAVEPFQVQIAGNTELTGWQMAITFNTASLTSGTGET